MSVTKYSKFSLTPISNLNNFFPRDRELNLKVINSRLNSTGFNLYASIKEDFELVDAIIFRKFDNEIITLSTNPILVYSDTNNNILNNITYSKERGTLLDLNNNFLEINKEYQVDIIWKIE